MFLAVQKQPYKTPQKACIPPQTHHAFTTKKHQKIAKPPAKTTLSPPKIFFSKTIPRLIFSPSKADRKAGTPHAAS
jgi:hypothetical protein